MKRILFIDRQSGKTLEEKVYFGSVIRFLYGSSLPGRILGRPLSWLASRFPFFSASFGWWNSLPRSKKKIKPFIDRYQLDVAEFRDSVDSYSSFNAFFTRKLKKEARPVAEGKRIAVMPADARYLFYPDISLSDGFLVKGQKFNLTELVQDKELAEQYERGSMVIARLCPTDYHRYHFPISCTPGESTLINGYLYSVNPLAIKQDIHILTKNKRVLCPLESETFGKVLFIEVGATNVGSIHQTYAPGKSVEKGEEKGYFAFGASTLILLFEPGRITFDSDLLEASSQKLEVRCLMGQSLGKACGAGKNAHSAT